VLTLGSISSFVIFFCRFDSCGVTIVAPLLTFVGVSLFGVMVDVELRLFSLDGVVFIHIEEFICRIVLLFCLPGWEEIAIFLFLFLVVLYLFINF
jgi:hypothetical protein